MQRLAFLSRVAFVLCCFLLVSEIANAAVFGPVVGKLQMGKTRDGIQADLNVKFTRSENDGFHPEPIYWVSGDDRMKVDYWVRINSAFTVVGYETSVAYFEQMTGISVTGLTAKGLYDAIGKGRLGPLDIDDASIETSVIGFAVRNVKQNWNVFVMPERKRVSVTPCHSF